ncbi:Cytochrome c, class I (modular protein) [Mesorhizobium delmotii]|uniref:Cytochrome c, class I (Modular protein) n=2 Tax=Mesorhizobium delmotii TaxID=1631247 RepID=A0A2P9ARH9_9HYPH|nr:Cytochrome c, class I (modular protein) [Mesorhizobium delmotii]
MSMQSCNTPRLRQFSVVRPLAALSGATALVLIWLFGASPGETAAIAQGRQLYAANCASCHGANLEGQLDWKRPLPSGRMPAPPHDASGHTWHHPDGVLFRITKEGPAAVVGGGYESDMPGFRGVLSDKEIRGVLAFIKSTWPERERRAAARRRRYSEGACRPCKRERGPSNPWARALYEEPQPLPELAFATLGRAAIL